MTPTVWRMQRVAWLGVVCVGLVSQPTLAAEEPKLRTTIGPFRVGITSMAFSPDGKVMVSARGGSIRLWDVTAGKETATLDGRSVGIMSVAISPDGKTLAAGSLAATVQLWDVATAKETALLNGHTGQVGCVAFSPDGKTLA